MPGCKRASAPPDYSKAREALIGRAERLADDETEGCPVAHHNAIHARAFSLAMTRLSYQHGLIDYNPQEQEPPVPLVLPKAPPAKKVAT